MPSLSFKKRFSPAILALIKKQTIRAPRKKPIKQGDTLYLYEGLRTKHTKHLMNVVCKDTCRIRLTAKSVTLFNYCNSDNGVMHKKLVLTNHYGLDEFAMKDGFDNWADMINFWKATHGKEGSPFPFNGNLYTW